MQPMSENVVSVAVVEGRVAEALLVIRDFNDLRALGESRLLYSKQPLAISLPGLPTEKAEALSERLNRYRNECGCSLGAKCMAAGFVAALAWLSAWHGVFTAAFLWRLPLAFLFTLACAGAGKISGISVAL